MVRSSKDRTKLYNRTRSYSCTRVAILTTVLYKVVAGRGDGRTTFAYSYTRLQLHSFGLEAKVKRQTLAGPVTPPRPTAVEVQFESFVPAEPEVAAAGTIVSASISMSESMCNSP